jgi:ribonuclease P protein component
LHKDQHIFNLSKKERLKSEKIIAGLFEQGKIKSHGCLRMLYHFTQEDQPLAVQVLFSVPKRNFKKAIKRNLLKRRIKEAYRLNKFELTTFLNEKKIKVLLAFLFIDKEVKSYSDIEKSVKYLLNSLLFK